VSLEKEYSSLRDEILQLSDRQFNLVTFALTVTIALIGYGISNNNGFIPLVPLLMLAFVLVQLVRVRRGMIRISSYISFFIEYGNDMGWETRANQLRQITAKEKALKRSGVTQMSLGILPIMVGFACIAISFAYLGWRLWPIPAAVAIVWLIFSIFIIAELGYAVSEELWTELTEAWREVQKNEGSSEEPPSDE